MHDESDVALPGGVAMTGTIILVLIWSLLVSDVLFALTG